jgi:hypothetical protein
MMLSGSAATRSRTWREPRRALQKTGAALARYARRPSRAAVTMRAIIVAGMVEDGLRLSKKCPPPRGETAAPGAIENSPGGETGPRGCSRGRDAQETKRSPRHRAASVSRRRTTLGWVSLRRLGACNGAFLGAAVGEHHIAIGRISFGETTRTGPRWAGIGAGRRRAACWNRIGAGRRRAAGWNRIGATVVSYRVGWAALMPGAVSTVPSAPTPSAPTRANPTVAPAPATPTAPVASPVPSTPVASPVPPTPMAAPVPPSRRARGCERGGAERCECCKCEDRFACEHEYLLLGCRVVQMRQPSRLLVQEPL